MPIDSSTGCHLGLDNRFVKFAKIGVAAHVKQRTQRRAACRAWKKDAAQTIRWLREIENEDAAPVMRAIAKAEKIVGRRLVISIDAELMLCSRGFRVAPTCLEFPDEGFLDFTTFKIRKRSLKWQGGLVSEGEGLRNRIKAALKKPDIEKWLLYQGLDEWPLVAKICLYGAMVGTGFLPWWLVVYEIHCADFRRAFTPVGD